MKRHCRLVLAAALVALFGACRVDEDVVVNPDGSGTYRAKVSVNKDFGEILPQLKAEASAHGLRLLDEGESAETRFVVVGRDFSKISELSDKDDRYSLQIESTGLVSRTFRLAIQYRSNPGASGFDRLLRVHMPAAVTASSGGQTAGRTVEWECSHGGNLDLVATGVVLPASLWQATAAGPVLALALLLLAGSLAKRRPAGSRQVIALRAAGGLLLVAGLGLGGWQLIERQGAGGFSTRPAGTTAGPAGTKVERVASTGTLPEDDNDLNRQKKTMESIRNAGTAMFSWLTDQVGAAAAGQQVNVEDYPALSSFEQIEKVLVPTYIKSLPARDGWGHAFEYRLAIANPTGKHVMLIRSPGRDGRFSAQQYPVAPFPSSDYDHDIVWADGYFVQWPVSSGGRLPHGHARTRRFSGPRAYR